jgi:ATP-dependent protease HslVU (ClpYQ) ATPase subunit
VAVAQRRMFFAQHCIRVFSAAMAKFARGNRYSQMEYQEKYKEECRKIFEVQSKSLGSNHIGSTDNETSADEDSDVDEMTKNLESMLEPTVSKQTPDKKNTTDTADATKKTVERHKLISTDRARVCVVGFTRVENRPNIYERERTRISTGGNHPETNGHRSVFKDSFDERQRFHVSVSSGGTR